MTHSKWCTEARDRDSSSCCAYLKWQCSRFRRSSSRSHFKMNCWSSVARSQAPASMPSSDAKALRKRQRENGLMRGCSLNGIGKDRLALLRCAGAAGTRRPTAQPVAILKSTASESAERPAMVNMTPQIQLSLSSAAASALGAGPLFRVRLLMTRS